MTTRCKTLLLKQRERNAREGESVMLRQIGDRVVEERALKGGGGHGERMRKLIKRGADRERRKLL